MQLQGKVAIVTGSTSGLGKAVALRYAQEGCRVIVHGTNGERSSAVRDEIGAAAEVFLGDLSQPDVATNLADFAVERFGAIDILFNSAGVVKMEPFLDFKGETWRQLVDVHLSGAFYCSQAAARHMANAGNGGRIIHVSTIAASFGQFGFTAYSPVKAGVEALTRVTAVELAVHQINVNCIAPGPVWNGMLENLYGAERLRERCKTIPLQRMALDTEVADLAVFLASPASNYITGQVLHLDGGASAAGPFTMEVYRRAGSTS